MQDDARPPVSLRYLVTRASNYDADKESYCYLLDILLKKPLITKKMFCWQWIEYVIEIYRKKNDANTTTGSQEDIDDLCKILVENLNKKVTMLGLRVVEYPHEITGLRYIALVTTRPNSNSLLKACSLSSDDRYLVLKFVDHVMVSNEGFFERGWAVNLGHDLPNPMNAVKVEALLDRLVADKWLECENGDYYLGVRGMAELAPTLQKKLDTLVCLVCERVCFRKNRVMCHACMEPIHDLCWKMLWKARPDETTMTCPNKNCNAKMMRTQPRAVAQTQPPPIRVKSESGSDEDEAMQTQ